MKKHISVVLRLSSVLLRPGSQKARSVLLLIYTNINKLKKDNGRNLEAYL